jgi:hypothetical protein
MGLDGNTRRALIPLIIGLLIAMWLLINGLVEDEGIDMRSAGMVYVVLAIIAIMLYVNGDKIKWKG